MKPVTSFIAVGVIILLGLSSCSVDSFDQGTNTLTDQESLIAGQIIGESVSENQSGLLSSFSEAFAVPTESNLITGPSLLSTESFRDLENYNHEFDPETGVHHVTFNRDEENELYSSTSTFNLEYTFFDSRENIIEEPALNQSEIDALEYSATRTGTIQSDSKTSHFTRTDRLFLDGLSSNSDLLTIDGFHSGEGSFTQIRPDGDEIDREYLLDINYLDIQIDKAIVQSNRNFRKGVYGALSYESTVRELGNSSPDTKIINGTIELNGDGTALLKFREQFDTFRLQLKNGEVFDEDDFEGRVTRVNLDEGFFTISNGQRIQVNEQTEIEDGDFNSLEELDAAVNAGVRVIAEGDYFHPDANVNLWIATEVEFELESNDFEDRVTSVDPNQNSFTLTNGDQFFLTDESIVEYEDGLDSFQDFADAVNQGMPVEADGEFYIDMETGHRIVKEVEFELEFDEFDEEVKSVNLEERRFTLESDKVLQMTDETIIIEDGDFTTLEEVYDALQEVEEVTAEGKFYFDSSTGYWIVVDVEFSD